MFGLETPILVLLIVCITAACVFEFINGFHDTANAVATVIYTNSLKPHVAVIWSGIWNFLGVYLGGIVVAMGIVNLLPHSTYMDQNIMNNIAMILALILTAIIWNFGTWYLGLPCSSSHTLIGSIFGVGIAFLLIPGNENVIMNWHKIKDAMLSLLISPVIGFGLTMLLMLFMKKSIKNKEIFQEPKKGKTPPFWIRGILILTCTGVSYSHGSNDGQKGVGLVMIILFSLLPFAFSLNHDLKPQELANRAQTISRYVNKSEVLSGTEHAKNISNDANQISQLIGSAKLFNEIPDNSHAKLRQLTIDLTDRTNKIIREEKKSKTETFDKTQMLIIKSEVTEIKKFTDYSPNWVILMISLSLGIGTMVGWKRIVVTIGEKIGKTHLTYAQGASAEVVAASTIAFSTVLGLPVSTTHVLSSGVAGSMVAHDGVKNLQMKTVRNILIAWLVTLPVTIILAGLLFIFLRWTMV